MVILELLVALAMWLATGHAIDTIYRKAGFLDTPRFVFWVPALNFAFLVYLAFVDWPVNKEVS
jgi:hypothetical protein